MKQIFYNPDIFDIKWFCEKETLVIWLSEKKICCDTAELQILNVPSYWTQFFGIQFTDSFQGETKTTIYKACETLEEAVRILEECDFNDYKFGFTDNLCIYLCKINTTLNASKLIISKSKI